MDSEQITLGLYDTLWHQLFGAKPRRCVFCHVDIPSLFEKAHHHNKTVRAANRHQPGIDDTYDLCRNCHGLQHAGIISIDEVRAAADATAAGTRKVTPDEVYRQIKADLDIGRRKIDWQALHGSTFKQRSERAQRAHASRRREREAAGGKRQEQPSLLARMLREAGSG
jgi:hypothetical protein